MNFQINRGSESDDIERIASIILTSTIYANDKQYNITECEVYWNDIENHNDGYTHKHNRPAGQWSIHPSGIDITLRSEHGHGGILIRGIQHKDDKPIDGPWLALEEVTRNIGSVSNPRFPKLILADYPIKSYIKSPRVGLTYGDGTKWEYLFKPYRFQWLDDGEPVSGKDKALTFLARYYPTSFEGIKLDATRNAWISDFKDGRKNAHETVSTKSVPDKCKAYGKWISDGKS